MSAILFVGQNIKNLKKKKTVIQSEYHMKTYKKIQSENGIKWCNWWIEWLLVDFTQNWLKKKRMRNTYNQELIFDYGL